MNLLEEVIVLDHHKQNAWSDEQINYRTGTEIPLLIKMGRMGRFGRVCLKSNGLSETKALSKLIKNNIL